VINKERPVSRISSFLMRIRRNHALEHATVHMLMRSSPSLRLVGRSDWDGFTLYGDVETRQVLGAVVEGLAQLNEGHSWLALHPHCGTNLAVTTLLMVSSVALVSLLPTRSRWARGAAALAAMLLARQASPALSAVVQRSITTASDVGGAHIRLVRREAYGKLTTHRILVTHDQQASDDVLHLSR